MFHTTSSPMKAILASVSTQSFDNVYSMSELENLCQSLEIEVVAKVIQNKEKIDNALYLGKGKLEELKILGENLQADYIIVDDELTAMQMRNIETATALGVLDRTLVVLDIFAQNATSKEGKIQVELAQYRYRLPRLTGLGTSLSRLGAGIGTRGPGESKLETDRRHIHNRIDKLKEDLAEIIKQRQNTKKQRVKNKIPTVAIVGYTNVGKSTLLNHLTGSDVLEQNKLFATLDPTARKFTLPNQTDILFIDTVGFMSRLPHHLVKSFSSTLEVAKDADLILNVLDASSPYLEQQIEITQTVLTDIGADQVEMLYVMNKCDLATPEEMTEKTKNIDFYLPVSAILEEGFPRLIEDIQQRLCKNNQKYTLLLPYEAGGLLHYLKENSHILKESYENEGLLLEIELDKRLAYKVMDYIKS